MRCALAFNPGSNSLKFELAELTPGAATASDLSKLVSASVDDIGKEPTLSVYKDREVAEKRSCNAADMQEAVRSALAWLKSQELPAANLKDLAFMAVRVVHGGARFDGPAEATEEVRKAIAELQELAPLHNENSLKILQVLDELLPDVRKTVTFDTSFHRTLPEVAWRYAIDRETADRWGVRKFGFHGLSHRYLLGQYAKATGKPPEACTVITLHLESGSSACAIRDGKSVDTSMGLTPLEGLMMGTRSGSVDPAILPYLMGKLKTSAGEVLQLLEKQSGLLGVAGETLDTRELVKRDDRWARLALEMFSYRVRMQAGAYLAALGPACEAVIFGGGIGEDSPWLRTTVCEGLTGWGMQIDQDANEALVQGQGRVSTAASRLQAWGMASEEGLQMLWECSEASV